MSDDYLFKPDSTILNGLVFGSEAGSSLVDPELRQIITQNRTLEAVKQLGQLQGASLVGQRVSHDLQRETNSQLEDLSGGVQQMGHEMAAGMNDIAYSISDGMSRQNARFQELSNVTQEGFQQLGLGLRSGFQSVVRGLYHVDERLGQRLMLGFSAVSHQLQQQHEETQATLIDGFDFVSEAIGQAGAGTISAIQQSTQTNVAALYQASQAQLQATQSAADQITRAVVETGRLQTEALLAAFHHQSQQLDALRHDVRHPAANEATEHFLVGMNFLNHLDFGRAYEQFQKARERYAGHFPTLFAAGFCCFVLGKPDAAQDAFEAALSQTTDDPERARRQHSLAALYLGRLAFDRAQYKRAQRHFEQAYTDQPEMWNALVEAAASRLLDPHRTDRAADAKSVQRLFNSQPPERAYLHWYLLALLLADLAPDIAREVFRVGATGDYRAREQNRVEVIALLWRLHPRQVPSLLVLVQDDFPWLR